MTTKSLKAEPTRRAAKPADEELADTLHEVWGNLDRIQEPLREAMGAANAVEIIGDDMTDTFIQPALHALAHYGQGQLVAAKEIVKQAIGIIENSASYRRARLEAEARVAATWEDVP